MFIYKNMNNFVENIKSIISTGNGIYNKQYNSTNMGVLEISSPSISSIPLNYTNYSLSNSNIPQLSIGSVDKNTVLQIGINNLGHSIFQTVQNNSNDNILFQPIGGNVGINTSNARATLDIYNTDALVLPLGTTNERPGTASGSSATGMIRFNTELDKFEGNKLNNTWSYIFTLADASYNTYIIPEDYPGANNNEIKFQLSETQHILDPSGNLGVGKVPEKRLDISGDMQYNGNIYNGNTLLVERIKKNAILSSIISDSDINETTYEITFNESNSTNNYIVFDGAYIPQYSDYTIEYTQVINLIDNTFYPTIVFEGEGLSNTYSQSSYLRYYIMGPTFYLYHGNGITYNGIGIVNNTSLLNNIVVVKWEYTHSNKTVKLYFDNSLVANFTLSLDTYSMYGRIAFAEKYANKYSIYSPKISYGGNTYNLFISEPYVTSQTSPSIYVSNNYDENIISINSDGTVLAVIDNKLSKISLYTYEQSTMLWSNTGSISVTDTVNNCALSGDGTKIIIGMPEAGTNGIVKIYHNNLNIWSQIGSNITGENTSDNAGFSVDINYDGSIIAVASTTTIKTVNIFDPMSGLISISGRSTKGNVRLFEFNTSTTSWDSTGKVEGIVSSYGGGFGASQFGHGFGYSISLNNSGTIIAVGEPEIINNDPNTNSGRVFVYKYENGSWKSIGLISGISLGSYSGHSVSLNGEGNVLAFSAPKYNNNSGNVRIYNYDDSTLTWSMVSSINGSTNSLFGNSLSLNYNGDKLLIGSPLYTISNCTEMGNSTLYTVNNNVWSKSIDISGGYSYVNSGHNVLLNNSGNRLFISSPGYTHLFQGQIWVYNISNNAKINNNNLILSNGNIGIGTVPQESITIQENPNSNTDISILNNNGNSDLFLGDLNNGFGYFYNGNNDSRFTSNSTIFYTKSGNSINEIFRYKNDVNELYFDKSIGVKCVPKCSLTINGTSNDITDLEVTGKTVTIYGSNENILWVGHPNQSEGVQIGSDTIQKYNSSSNIFNIESQTNMYLNMNGAFYATGNCNLLQNDIYITYTSSSNQFRIIEDTFYFFGNNTTRLNIQTNNDLYINKRGGTVFIGDSTTTSIGATLTIDGDVYTQNFLTVGRDDGTTNERTIFFGGTNENSYNNTVISKRYSTFYYGNEYELLFFKGDDADSTNGPDRIRLYAGLLRFDTGSNSGMYIDGDYGFVVIGQCNYPGSSYSSGNLLVRDSRTSLKKTSVYTPNSIYVGIGTMYGHSDAKFQFGGLVQSTNSRLEHNNSGYFYFRQYNDTKIVLGKWGVELGTPAPEFPFGMSLALPNRSPSNVGINAGPGSYLKWNSHNGPWIGQLSSSNSTQMFVYTEGAIYATSALGASDIRSKNNIHIVPENVALHILENTPVRMYEYIDYEYGTKKVIGFIAQEVKETLPMAVQNLTKTIPSVFNIIKDVTWKSYIDDSGNILYKLYTNDISNISNVKYRFYVTNNNDINIKDEELEIIGNSDNSFTFDKKWDYIFCYGHEVDDFNCLFKDKLFTINFAATKAIDKIQLYEIEKLSNHQNNINILEENANGTKNILDTLKTDIMEINKKIMLLKEKFNLN